MISYVTYTHSRTIMKSQVSTCDACRLFKLSSSWRLAPQRRQDAVTSSHPRPFQPPLWGYGSRLGKPNAWRVGRPPPPILVGGWMGGQDQSPTTPSCDPGFLGHKCGFRARRHRGVDRPTPTRPSRTARVVPGGGLPPTTCGRRGRTGLRSRRGRRCRSGGRCPAAPAASRARRRRPPTRPRPPLSAARPTQRVA